MRYAPREQKPASDLALVAVLQYTPLFDLLGNHNRLSTAGAIQVELLQGGNSGQFGGYLFELVVDEGQLGKLFELEEAVGETLHSRFRV